MTLTTARWETTEASGRSDGTGRSAGRLGRRSWLRWTWAVLIAVAILGSALVAGVGQGGVVKPEGKDAFSEFFRSAAHPRLDGEFIGLTLNATATTLAYAVLGTALSLVIGIAGGVLGSQTWWILRWRRGHGRASWMVSRALLVIPRGIHEVVWGLLFLAIFGLDPIVAVLAIGIPFGAVTAKVFSELLDETSREPYTALLAIGASRRSAVLYGLLPPALSDLLSYGFYRFECAIRSAAILGLVGAGGLGFELALSFQTLRYAEIWTLLYALILLSVGAEYWSVAIRARRARAGRRALRRDPLLMGSLLFALLLVATSWWWVGLDPSVMWSAQARELGLQVLIDAWPPALPDGGWYALLELSAITLAMSILAIAIAFVGGAVLAFPAAKLPRTTRPRSGRSAKRAVSALVRLLSRFVLIVLRAIPPPVWALLLLFVLFPGILPGALALGVYTAGVLGRLMAEAAEGTHELPLRALRAHGASGPTAFCYGVLPAAVPRFVAYGLYRWEVTIRETVVVGVVGAAGLGLLLDHQLSSLHYGGALATLVTLIAVTFAVDLTSAAIRRTLR